MNTCQPTKMSMPTHRRTSKRNRNSYETDIWLAGRTSRSIAFTMMYFNLGLAVLFLALGSSIGSPSTFEGVLGLLVIGFGLFGAMTVYNACNVVGLAMAIVATITSRSGEPRGYAFSALLAHGFLFVLPILFISTS